MINKEIEQKIIIDYNEKQLSIIKLHKKYGFCNKTISKILIKNNIEVINRQNKLFFNIDDVVKDYNSGLSLTKMSKKYKTSRDTLSKHLKKAGVKVVNRQNITKFNENVFDSIDTEEKAYWLGFIYADGCISNRDYSFELSLSLHDIEHLRKFAKFMGYENNIKQDSYRCRFCITNKHLWNTLNSYGCTPRKSLTLEFPNEKIFKSKDLIRHFIRGYFDGDGCVSYYIYKDIYKLHVSCLGTKLFLDRIIEYANIKCSIRKSKSQAMLFNLSLNKSILFCEYVYNNCSIYLDRKYLRYFYLKDGNCRSIKELIDY